MNKTNQFLVLFTAVPRFVWGGGGLIIAGLIVFFWFSRSLAADLRPEVSPELTTWLAEAKSDAQIEIIVRLRSRPAYELANTQPQAISLYLRRSNEASLAVLQSDLRRWTSQSGFIWLGELWIVNGFATRVEATVLAELIHHPQVLSIHLNRELPAPSGFTSAASSAANLTQINAPAMWAQGFEGQGVVVAILDTGVSASHTDLADSWRGGENSWFDPYNEHPDTPIDLIGHGTAVAGVLVGGEASGVQLGVAPRAQWIAARLYNDRGTATVLGIHRAFQWVLDPDDDPQTADAPQVINNSWAFSAPLCDLEFQPDLQALRAAAILPVFSAGNYGPAPGSSTSPANNPEAFAVGAINEDDEIWTGSSRGPSACGESEKVYPELVAPGVEVPTTWLANSYISETGTSLAAPHVSGALALLLSAYPGLDANTQAAALLAGALDLGTPGADNTFGAGRLDVLAAFEWLQSLPPTPTPTATLNPTPFPQRLPLIFQKYPSAQVTITPPPRREP